MTESSSTSPSDETLAAEERDAAADHGAPQRPSAEEDAAAPGSASPGVAEHYEEMLEKGANDKGEGALP